MEQIILFAPLLGALIVGFGHKALGDKASQWITTGLLFLAAALSWVVFLGFDGVTRQIELMTWIQSGTLDTSWAIRLDRLTAIMLVVINTVSALVHLYSMGYMAHDENWKEGESYRPRFFAYLSFFTFSMLMLVTADNLIQMFFGWEGVGVASYLLIGFYYRKPSANAAAIKAFVVNRVGDFGFALGIFGLFYLVDSVNLDDIFAAAPTLAETQISFLWTEWNAANLLAFLLFVGAMGKSAQLFLHTWLPDAMEGPTPVSALIHAATMVTAGVFLVCRMSPLFEFAPEAKAFIVFLGATTAFFAATVGLVQNDIKRVIAYSTCSQLGYMFVAAGVGVYSVAMFHLLTHAFFKAMLFLGAGSVIHGMHHEQDMRNYGGLRKKLPYTFWAMMIGTLAITGVGIPLTHYGFAGFLSKDAVIESAFAGTAGGYAFWMLVIAALFTSFYSWRLIFMTFFGKPRGDKQTHDHAHESPAVMLVPLGVLSLGAIFSGMLWYNSFFGHTDTVGKFFGVPYAEAGAHGDDHGAAKAEDGHGDDHGEAKAAKHHYVFTGKPGEGAIYTAENNTVLNDAHEVPKWVKVSPFVAMLVGFITAMWFYIWSPSLPAKLAESQRPLYLFLLNKWYFDEIYDFLFVNPAKALGRFLWKKGDGRVIDGTINGVAMGIIPFFTRLAGRAQSGYIFTYAFAMVLGVVVLVMWMAFTGGTR
ncbi:MULTISPECIES: NADH-quinone oxidoreductase subunit L [Lentibacter]|jgi:NADH-quinone oxidoreductase subunit L|uniref:NADH dehydrogenase subunit L n=2 Tax=Lentibacter algarum TaxID=576131 RepID=A0A1H3IE95_9RHOB|nr:NADH-quinone oxidoreductase subunit L [Lentibacter algarum]MCO4777827.1 NADH-quinone oxidoreductase subunit L [Lentibacter algarum]MCO4828826.1 NADH-quinone oxidoreductase subunit L [Lentibacter algarum]WIF31467.1 NADH-quinone oxidoreductase subunit L [Lentibacter algarum]SDY26060.1 NADH dehydrogenase subunit L [Lentibacter algarum]